MLLLHFYLAVFLTIAGGLALLFSCLFIGRGEGCTVQPSIRYRKNNIVNNSCNRLKRFIKLITTISLLLIGMGFFYCLSLCCMGLVGDYSSEPVYEVDARQVQPEYEGKMVRVRGVVEEKLPGEGWRARLGAFELCHGGGGFASMYTRQNHPDIGSEVFLVGRQHGNRIQVFHHFEGCYLAWKLCSHQLVIYAGGILNTGVKLLGVVGLYALGWLAFWAMWWYGDLHPRLWLRLAICTGVPLLLYLAGLRDHGFAVNKFIEVVEVMPLQWAPVLSMVGALLLPALLTLALHACREKRWLCAVRESKLYRCAACALMGGGAVLLTALASLSGCFLSEAIVVSFDWKIVFVLLCFTTDGFLLAAYCFHSMGALHKRFSIIVFACAPLLYITAASIAFVDETPHLSSILRFAVGLALSLSPLVCLLVWRKRNNIVNNSCK